MHFPWLFTGATTAIITLPFSCRAKQTWIDNMEPSVPLDTASHVVKVKTFVRRRRIRRRVLT